MTLSIEQLDSILAARPAFVAEAMEMADPDCYECEDWEQFQVIVAGLEPQIPCGECDECKAEICCRELDSTELSIWNDLVLWFELGGSN